MSRVIVARSNGVWLNEPVRWTAEADHLHILTDEATGFCRETHYGFPQQRAFPRPCRQRYLTAELRVRASSYLVGPMACTPERYSLTVEISAFHLTPPL